MRAKRELANVVKNDLAPNRVDLAARDYFNTVTLGGRNMDDFYTYRSLHGTGLTECLEPMVVGPETTKKFAYRVGMMLDIGVYGHPSPSIPGGCIEDAFAKDGRELLEFTHLEPDVNPLVGIGVR